jgi:hypothetical protein
MNIVHIKLNPTHVVSQQQLNFERSVMSFIKR